MPNRAANNHEDAKGQESQVCSAGNRHSQPTRLFGLRSDTGVMPNGSMELSGSAHVKLYTEGTKIELPP